MAWIVNTWSSLVGWVSFHLVAPVLQYLHLQQDPSEVAEASIITLLQLSIIAFIFRPLEDVAPVEQWDNRKATRIDRLYTVLMLLGVFPLFSYAFIAPISNWLIGGDVVSGTSESALNLRHLVPWFDSHPLVLFGVYYVLYDLTYYWIHRMQHLIPWWWALHSMHHSQRQMGCWTNDRTNYLDGAFESIVLAVVSISTGTDLSDFAWLNLISELFQDFSHANVRFGFGPILERVLVDPKFHRLHHMQVDPERPNLHNCNFGQLFPIWDMIFGTALYGEPPHPTGVGDPIIDADNGRNLFAMQYYSLRRFWGAISCKAGWRFGDVHFKPDYRPVPVDEPIHAVPKGSVAHEALDGASTEGST